MAHGRRRGRRASWSEGGRGAAGRVALTPSGQRVSLDGEGPEVLELSEQGFYEIRAQEREAVTAVVAATSISRSRT